MHTLEGEREKHEWLLVTTLGGGVGGGLRGLAGWGGGVGGGVGGDRDSPLHPPVDEILLYVHF